MTIEIYIWKKSKETGNFFIDDKIYYDEKDLTDFALAEHAANRDMDKEKYEYSATVEKTVIT